MFSPFLCVRKLVKQSLFITGTIAVSVLCLASGAKGATIVVPSGGDLQSAINASNCGDDIILQAGGTFTGNFTLRNKGACSDYINIRTSALSGIPAAGTRITPAYAAQMAKLVSHNGTATLQAEDGANHYKLIGIEISNIGGNVVTAELVLISGTTHHITFDRCWIHEATNDTTTPDSIFTTATRGLNINATDITITECRIAGFRAYLPGGSGDPSVQASNAILFPNSALRVTVNNTYLEAWFVPLFFGGSGGNTANTATLSNPTYDVNTHTGTATFSSVSNLSVGDLVAFQVAGGRTPATNYSHPGELVVYQVGKVTGIAGNVVSFQAWGSYDGDINGGNPILQAPCACGNQPLPGGYRSSPIQAQWNGYLNQDITIQRNQFVLNFASTEQVWVLTGGSPTTLPRSTQVNLGNAPKGLIELKMAKNVLIDGNTFEGWASGLVITSRNQGSVPSSGGFPWAGVFNVTVSNNWWKRTPNWDRIYGFPIGGPQLQDNEYANVRSGPVTVANNLIESGTGPILASMGAADNVSVVHNTYPGSATPPGNSMVIGQGANSPNFVFKDNILSNNEYGLNCQSAQPCWPNLVQNHNVIIDNRSPNGQIADGPLTGRYPNDFIAASQASILWMDSTNRDYRLANSSAYKGQASDGTDPGVNWTTLASHLGFDPRNSAPVPTPAPTPTPTPSPSPTPTPAPVMELGASILRAKREGQNLANQVGSGGTGTSNALANSTEQVALEAFIGQIQQAREYFNANSQIYPAAARISSELNGALQTALQANSSFTQNDIAGFRTNLRQAISHLELAAVLLAQPNVTNPIDVASYVVRQHYVDFFDREPDQPGSEFWVNQFSACGVDAACFADKRIHVSAAFFLSIEFQQTGYFVHRLYRSSYGRIPLFAEFMPDNTLIGRGVIVDTPGWEARLAASKQAFLDGWVQRADFTARYSGLTNEQFVDTLIANLGIAIDPAERDKLVLDLVNGSSRAIVLGKVAQNPVFSANEFNTAFVLMQYFGYLRRDPDTSGFNFWKDKLDQFGGNYQSAEMVKAFLASDEYRTRFSL